MLAAQRHQELLSELHRQGQIKVSALAEYFQVSEMTIRRDIEELDQQGKLVRVHGGALPTGSAVPSAQPRTFEPGFRNSLSTQSEQKRKIAEYCAALLKPGMSVVVGAGSTTYALAAKLAQLPDLSILTNSYPLAAELFSLKEANRTERHFPQVILCGGELTPSQAMVGPIANHTLSTFNADLSIVGSHAIDATGFSTPNVDEAATNRALLKAGARSIVLADSTKFGKRALAQFATPEKIDLLITDHRTEPVAQFEDDTGASVQIAGPEQ